MVGDEVVHSLEWGSLRIVASESSRQATTMVMKSPLQPMQLVTVEAEKKMTRLGPMCGPAWRARPSQLSSGAQVMGPGVPSVSDNVGIPEAPQILPQGPVMVQELGTELGPLSQAC